jgi:hypothetical protein
MRRRYLGVVVCLAALMLAIFGHNGMRAGAMPHFAQTIIQVEQTGHSSASTDHRAVVHCAQHAQCSYYALLTSEYQFVQPTQGISAQSAAISVWTRTITPQPQPPKFS